MEAATPKRSPIPKVIGILMLTVAAVSLVNAIYGALHASGAGIEAGPHGALLALFQDSPTVSAIKRISKLVAILLACFEIVAGIALLRYRRRGISLAIAYAAAHLAGGVAFGAVLFVLRGPTTAGIAAALVALFSAVAWPTVILALVTRPSAKAACALPGRA